MQMRTVDTPGLLSVREAAGILRVSRPTMYRLLRRGDVPGYLVGGQIRVDTRELLRFLDSTRIERSSPTVRRPDGETARPAA